MPQLCHGYYGFGDDRTAKQQEANDRKLQHLANSMHISSGKDLYQVATLSTYIYQNTYIRILFLSSSMGSCIAFEYCNWTWLSLYFKVKPAFMAYTHCNAAHANLFISAINYVTYICNQVKRHDDIVCIFAVAVAIALWRPVSLSELRLTLLPNLSFN